nr:hypothetical protein [Entomoplasma sp. MP1]
MKFEIMQEIESDKYLTNYFQAYSLSNNKLLSNFTSTSNVSSLMFLENLCDGASSNAFNP